MKHLKDILTAILVILFIGYFTSCKNNPFKKSLKETLIEHNWIVTKWMSVPGQVEATADEDLYARFYDEDCKINSYSDYAEDGTIFFHNLCYDTITNRAKWNVVGNEKLILTHPLWSDSLQEYKGDTTQTWEVLDFSRKEIELKMDYIFYYDGGQINYTETKTLEAL